MEARIVWLQRSAITDDQVFDSFAIFPDSARTLITTSRRAITTEENGPAGQTQPNGLAVLTVLGTFSSISGFIVQFVGLRAMNWTAPVALLGATIVMAGIRVVVRRNLATLPKSQRLVPGHEMDWLAMTLADDPERAPWMNPKKANDDKLNGAWDCTIRAVEDPGKCHKLEPRQDEDAADGKESIAHRAMKIRKGLGNLAGWSGPASAEAVALARAIELTMNTLFKPYSTGQKLTTLNWSLATRRRPHAADPEFIRFRIKRDKRQTWKADAREIEAALSLWLYYASKGERDWHDEGNTRSARDDDSDDDSWLRATETGAKRNFKF